MNGVPSHEFRLQLEREQTKTIAKEMGARIALIYVATFAFRRYGKKKGWVD